jgi:hypothetical protein
VDEGVQELGDKELSPEAAGEDAVDNPVVGLSDIGGGVLGLALGSPGVTVRLAVIGVRCEGSKVVGSAAVGVSVMGLIVVEATVAGFDASP